MPTVTIINRNEQVSSDIYFIGCYFYDNIKHVILPSKITFSLYKKDEVYPFGDQAY
jgi:hypothetical protein